MTTEKCPVCQGTQWTVYPAVKQCDNCGHMEPVRKIVVVDGQYVDAAQHSRVMSEREGA